jgi:large subunit ribosomal protein L21
MYAVIRAGGKQYRVAPGDIVKIERLPAGQGEKVEFDDVLAVSSQEGQIGFGRGARVSGQVVESGRSDKILVFHFKRKKQYKKIFGHRQPFTTVRITEIAFNGQKFAAPDLPARKARPAKSVAEGAVHKAKAKATSAAKKPEATAKKRPAKKGTGKKK